MSRYEAAHVNPEGPGDSRPTALQIVKDEGAEGKLKCKVIVITGTSSGLGIETVRALASTGATLFLTGRDIAKSKTVLAKILNPERMELIQMDQGSFDSVRAAAKTILAKTDKVNILINNAGIMAVPDLQFTTDGHELQFGTNHLSHFLFFQLLKPALLAAATPGLQSRVVNLASSGHKVSGINESDNYNFQKGGYSPWTAYGQSKTANIYMANEIDRRYGSQGLHATSVQPGGVATALQRNLPAADVEAWTANKEAMKVMKNQAQGAATTVWAAIGKEWENKGGKYLENCAEAKRDSDDGDLMGVGHASHAYSEVNEARLWADSLKIVGLTEA
ncbi:hypothetical protein QQX98_004075 [Neonectria punicea]|uniref:NAD(P)-binding protein n=1 Tax=Neonectria punicea TaxID=979145 RepID=A0ABR1HB12_9HYPO